MQLQPGALPALVFTAIASALVLIYVFDWMTCLFCLLYTVGLLGVLALEEGDGRGLVIALMMPFTVVGLYGVLYFCVFGLDLWVVGGVGEESG